jgi:hypothetical protein
VQVQNNAPVPLANVTFELQGILGGQLERRPFSVNNVPASRLSEYDSGLTLPVDTDMATVRGQAIVRSVTLN